MHETHCLIDLSQEVLSAVNPLDSGALDTADLPFHQNAPRVGIFDHGSYDGDVAF